MANTGSITIASYWVCVCVCVGRRRTEEVGFI